MAPKMYFLFYFIYICLFSQLVTQQILNVSGFQTVGRSREVLAAMLWLQLEEGTDAGAQASSSGTLYLL